MYKNSTNAMHTKPSFMVRLSDEGTEWFSEKIQDFVKKKKNSKENNSQLISFSCSKKIKTEN